MSRGQPTGRLRLLAGSICARTGRQRSARPTVALLACLLVAAASCSGDDEEADATPSRTTTLAEREPTSTTLDPEEAEREAVIAAGDAAAQARIDSAAAPDPDPTFPAIAETHTGAMLEQWVDTVTILEFNGFAIRYPDGSQHQREVESVDFDQVEGEDVAFLEVCTVDDGERYVIDTGQVLDSGVSTIQATEAMRNEGGVWKLAERRETNTWQGVAGCAAD